MGIRTWILATSAFALFGILEGVLIHIGESRFRDFDPPSWGEALGRGALNWSLWGLVGIGVFNTVRWLLDHRVRGIPHAVAHLPLAVISIGAYVAANAGFTSWREPGVEFFELAELLILNQGTALLSIYIGIVAACYAYLYYRPALAATRLEVRLERTKLEALRMQLQPHFLFNTLNSIIVLVRKDPELAENTIQRLADLLRQTLAAGKWQEVALREELEFLERYIAIERVRFRDRLRFERDVPEELLDLPVPALALQPIVENSIRHGVAKRVQPVTIRVTAERQGDELLLSVADDGPGFGPEVTERNGRIPSSSGDEVRGVGLQNTRERVEQLNRGRDAFEIRSGDEGGVEVRMRLPVGGTLGATPARQAPEDGAQARGEAAEGSRSSRKETP